MRGTGRTILVVKLVLAVSLTTGMARAAIEGSYRMSAAGTAAAPTNVTVDSRLGWQRTPLSLSGGDQFTVSYVSGTWTVDHRAFAQVGPDGYTSDVDRQIYQGCKLVSDWPYARLVARVGGTGAILPIGRGETFSRPHESGDLYLRIHDDDTCLGDNAGQLTVSVRSSPTSPPVPAPKPTASKPKPAPKPAASKCPLVSFIGVRGSGETNKDAGGYGVPVGQHRDILERLLVSGWGSKAFLSTPIDYPAVAVDKTWLETASYLKSVRRGVKTLDSELQKQYKACESTRQVFALAGYSQGAHVIDNELEHLARQSSKILPRIASVTLYGDPRRSDADGRLRWEVGENSSKYQGLVVQLRVARAFENNPVGDKLLSYCNQPRNGLGPDPICALPRNTPLQSVPDYVKINRPQHAYHRSALLGAEAAVERISKAVCGSLSCKP